MIGGMHIQVVITWVAAPIICREVGELGLPAGNQTWLAGKSPIPDAPGMAYLPTYLKKLPSFVGKYSSTMEHLDIYIIFIVQCVSKPLNLHLLRFPGS